MHKPRRARFAVISVLLLGAAAWAQPLEQVWLRQFGTPAADNAYALAPRALGGVYIAGNTNGALGGPNAGPPDAYVSRYDSDGGLVWVRQFGTPTIDTILAAAPQPAGGVFVAGFTDGVLAPPGVGETDAFVALYAADGQPVWLRQSFTTPVDSMRALAPDGAGGVFAAGTTEGPPGAGGEDATLVRFNAAGGTVWVRQFGSAGNEQALGAAPDGAGGVFLVGYTTGDLAGANAGSLDIFVARYDGAGTQLWVRQFGSGSYDQAVTAAADGAGGVFVGGATGGALTGTPIGGRDAFLARYDAAGTRLWLRQLGTSTYDDLTAVATDAEGGVYAAGYTLGNLGGPNAGAFDAFLSRYDGAGSFVRGTQFGTPASDEAAALAPDGQGGAYIAGGTLGMLGAASLGDRDGFVARFRVGCDPDINADGNTDQEDVACIINTVAGNPGCAAQDPDFNRDGNTDQEDVVAVITAVAGGGCP